MANLPAVFREYKRLEATRDSTGLSLDELTRWTMLKRILAEHFRPGAGEMFADKQSSLRVPVRLRVEFTDQGSLRQYLMTNISRGGVFIATEDPLPIGTSLELRIRMGDSGRLIQLKGEVASVNTGADLKSEEHGMGVRFAGLSHEDEVIVKELYGQAMEAAKLDRG